MDLRMLDRIHIHSGFEAHGQGWLDVDALNFVPYASKEGNALIRLMDEIRESLNGS